MRTTAYERRTCSVLSSSLRLSKSPSPPKMPSLEPDSGAEAPFKPARKSRKKSKEKSKAQEKNQVDEKKH
eukprot:1394916-Amorphochlora_amoeboformis.AAC.2